MPWCLGLYLQMLFVFVIKLKSPAGNIYAVKCVWVTGFWVYSGRHQIL